MGQQIMFKPRKEVHWDTCEALYYPLMNWLNHTQMAQKSNSHRREPEITGNFWSEYNANLSYVD